MTKRLIIRHGDGGFAPLSIDDTDHHAVGSVGDLDLKIAEGVGAGLERRFAELLADEVAGDAAQQLVLQALGVIVECTGLGSCRRIFLG